MTLHTPAQTPAKPEQPGLYGGKSSRRVTVRDIAAPSGAARSGRC